MTDANEKRRRATTALWNDPDYRERVMESMKAAKSTWSAADDEVIRLGWAEGTPTVVIAARLSTTRQSINRRAKYIGLPARPRSRRPKK